MVTIKYDFSLKEHNTFGIDAKCKCFITFDTIDDIAEVLPIIQQHRNNMIILGGGSNLLLTGDYDGLVVHPKIMRWEAADGADGVMLRVGCGMEWDELVELCVGKGWHGLENLSLIPGNVGASAVQNIGAYGAEAKDVIYKAEAIDLDTGEKCEFSNSDCQYSYRHSRFKSEWRGKYIITYVTYKLSHDFCPNIEYGNIKKELAARNITDNPTAEQLRDVIISIRRDKLPDPEVEGNAGSFFMNPVVGKAKYEELRAKYGDIPHYTIDDEREKIPAGWLIEQCGWKGKSLGRAGVHSKQALVLVNRGGATGGEVLELCRAVCRDVHERFAIEIKPEVNIV